MIHNLGLERSEMGQSQNDTLGKMEAMKLREASQVGKLSQACWILS